MCAGFVYSRVCAMRAFTSRPLDPQAQHATATARGDGEGEGGSMRTSCRCEGESEGEGSKGEGDEDEGVTVGAIKRRLARSLSGPRDRETIA